VEKNHQAVKKAFVPGQYGKAIGERDFCDSYFVAFESYAGFKRGYVFSRREKGTGYYKDQAPESAINSSVDGQSQTPRGRNHALQICGTGCFKSLAIEDALSLEQSDWRVPCPSCQVSFLLTAVPKFRRCKEYLLNAGKPAHMTDVIKAMEMAQNAGKPAHTADVDKKAQGSVASGSAASCRSVVASCCAQCGKTEGELGAGEKLRKCGGCGVARYCSGACQKLAWSAGHKKECRSD
jgi:hypothetical protein